MIKPASRCGESAAASRGHQINVADQLPGGSVRERRHDEIAAAKVQRDVARFLSPDRRPRCVSLSSANAADVIKFPWIAWNNAIPSDKSGFRARIE